MESGLVFSREKSYNRGRKEVWPVASDLHIHMLLDGVNYRQAIRRHSSGPAEDLYSATVRWSMDPTAPSPVPVMQLQTA